MDHTSRYIYETQQILGELLCRPIANMAEHLSSLREGAGRLFIVGVGGSAATASHACNDFRKLCGVEAYAPTDNVSELTARTNDEGWDTALVGWLESSRLCHRDALLVLSVGGGAPGVSAGIMRAIDMVRSRGGFVYGIVGRDGGYTAQHADVCVVIPPLYPERVTPHTEGIASVVLHLLVSHPKLQRSTAKWESQPSSSTETGR